MQYGNSKFDSTDDNMVLWTTQTVLETRLGDQASPEEQDVPVRIA